MRVSAFVFGLICAAALLWLRIEDPYLVRTVRELAFDQLQISNPRPYSELPVRIVDIDEASLAEFGQWPWPRTRLAELVNRLFEKGAAVVAFDIAFIEPDRLSPSSIFGSREFDDFRKIIPQAKLDSVPDNDKIFAQAIAGSRVVLGFAALKDKGGEFPPQKASFAVTGDRAIEAAPRMYSATRNLPELEAAASGIASISLSPASSEGVMRRIPLVWNGDDKFYPSLAIDALRVAQGEKTIVVFGAEAEPGIIEGLRVGQLSIPTARTGEMWMYYSRETPRRYVSAKDVLASSPDHPVDQDIAGNIIFVGTSAVGLLDIRTSARGERIPGVSVHAQIVEQVLTSEYLTRPDWVEAMEVVLFAVIAFMIVVTTIYFGPIYSLGLGMVAALSTIATSYLGFSRERLLIDFTYPLIAGALLLLLMTAYRYLTTDREKRLIRSAFAHYVAPSVLKQIEKDPRQVKIGGEIREISILFMDVRSFTSLSERMEPTTLVEFLNRLFAELTRDIVSNKGTLDKYIGDSIMAFWNAPTTIPQHQALACQAALAMRQSMGQMNANDSFHFKSRGLSSEPVAIGVGIASGLACVGNVGSDALFNYSAVGDTVNVAARVQDLCKHVGFDIVVSQQVADACPEFAFLFAGNASLKGKAGAQPVFILVGDANVRASERFASLERLHNRLVLAIAADEADYDAILRECMEAGRDVLATLGHFYELLPRRQSDFRGPAPTEVTREIPAIFPAVLARPTATALD